VAVVGVSTRPFCGVHHHATLLAGALEHDGVACSEHWLRSSAGSLRGAQAEFRSLAAELGREVDPERADAILLHYSVFAFSHRGVPLFVAPTMAALRRTRVPVIAIMHELAFPWGQAGAKGVVWAASQRAALIAVVHASQAVIVTADFRADWLRTRRWLPSRPVAVAPVFSNLPAPTIGPPAGRTTPVLGVFGYAIDRASVALVLDALGRLLRSGVQLQLQLLGSPGPASAAGEMWSAMAHSMGVGEALSFSGTLPAQEISDALASSDILLYADPTGPASRKGTLPGSLASGRPLVALEGRRSWSLLLDADAARVVPRTAAALADALAVLIADPASRAALGERGRSFAEDTMGVARTAEIVGRFLAQAPRAAAR
jgi:glycosyltransferase involved in cell wall biosynthesis